VTKAGSLVLALHRAAHRTAQRLSNDLADLRLTASEINALANLADGTPRTITELSSATGTRPTTLTGVLDRLQTRGLLTRQPHAADRRAIVVALTASGTAAAARVADALNRLEIAAMSNVDDPAKRGFHAVIGALLEDR
jgi:DNA-binding MarR family transcriptional regulator